MASKLFNYKKTFLNIVRQQEDGNSPHGGHKGAFLIRLRHLMKLNKYNKQRESA